MKFWKNTVNYSFQKKTAELWTTNICCLVLGFYKREIVRIPIQITENLQVADLIEILKTLVDVPLGFSILNPPAKNLEHVIYGLKPDHKIFQPAIDVTRKFNYTFAFFYSTNIFFPN